MFIVGFRLLMLLYLFVIGGCCVYDDGWVWLTVLFGLIASWFVVLLVGCVLCSLAWVVLGGLFISGGVAYFVALCLFGLLTLAVSLFVLLLGLVIVGFWVCGLCVLRVV